MKKEFFLVISSVLVFSTIYLLTKNIYSKKQVALPIVINTWPFTKSTLEAYNILVKSQIPKNPQKVLLDSIEKGCTVCEELQCDGTVGYGNSPDENGEVSLDAMIMCGTTMDVGAVGNLKNIKNAVGVARKVLDHTYHSFLVGSEVTDFALKLGFRRESLKTDHSNRIFNEWIRRGRVPNYWKENQSKINQKPRDGHDTIGMIAMDKNNNIACGTSTNGMTHKIPGRIGDSAIPGSGAYCENGSGGAAATGDGDVILRFSPSVKAVSLMKLGWSPRDACKSVLEDIKKFYPRTNAAMVALNSRGEFGGYAIGSSFSKGFKYSVKDPTSEEVRIYEIN